MTALESLFDQVFAPDHAERVAVTYEHREITYEELQRSTVRAAGSLHALGVRDKNRVAILLNDSPEFISSFVAIISLGAIAVPINMALSKDDQLFILKDCGARAAIIEAQTVGTLFSNADDVHTPATHLSELKDLLIVNRGQESSRIRIPGIRSHLDEEGSLSYVPSPMGEGWWRGLDTSPTTLPLNPLPSGEGRTTELNSLPDEFPRRGEEDADAFILYTSGSTGEPKGAVHRQVDIFYTNETFCREVLRVREGDRLFSSSRLPFAYGLGNSFTFPLLNGFTTILCREKPSPEVIARIFCDYHPTIFFAVPVVYRMLLEHQRNGNALDCSSLRLCVSAGEALPAKLGEEWQRTFSVQVLDGIGSTEMLHMFMSNHEGEVRYGSSGKLLRGYEARLIDHDGNATLEGEVGNLWIRGHSAAARYWERPETTAQTFVDGWVRTGDLYRRDAGDFWWHMGRSDDCFKPTGQWVSPVEVEGALLQNENLRAAAVVEGFDKDGLSCVCAFIVCKENVGEPQVEKDLRALCESMLPRFKQPRRYIFVSELPYTATGKVQRFKLREQLRELQRPTWNVQTLSTDRK